MLVLQWIWYEKLKHGRPVRLLWRKRRNNDFEDDSNITTAIYPGIDARAQSEPHLRFDSQMQQQQHIFKTGPLSPTKPKEIPQHRAREGIFAIPHYGSFQSIATRLDDDAASIAESTLSPMAKPRGRNNDRRLHRLQRKDQLPSPSPRTVLFLATIVLALANASPVPSSTHHLLSHDHHELEMSTWSAVLGPLLSWTSTALYLFSRLPQLLKNHSRRSTQGLSISLFIAAFFGNLFYSLSLLLNPLAWSSYPAHGCHGWASHAGSIRIDWLSNAAPFFLGAAGVLALDAAVAAQFWWFARESRRESDALLAHNLAKASIVSVRVDSERTLVGSREGAPHAHTKLHSTPPSLMTPPLAPVLGVLASDDSGEFSEGAEPVLVVGKPVPLKDEEGKFRWSWKEVDGWMRGWKPSYSAVKGRFMKPRPKSRLGREVSGDSDREGEEEEGEMGGEGEDVMEGSETQALLGER